MGTNFYSLNGRTHVGKRSSAGKYCWDCGITLCKSGEEYVHFSRKPITISRDNWAGYDPNAESVEWYDACPICGKKYEPPSDWNNAAGKELGFSTIKGKQTGVATCCSFTWAVKPDRIQGWKGVRDEYGKKYTMEEFKEELDFCPIRFYHSIGRDFC